MFENPINGKNTPFLQLSNEDLTPEIIAKIMVKSFKDKNSFARRAMIASFIKPHLNSLLVEVPNVLYMHSNAAIGSKQYSDFITLDYFKCKEHICKLLFGTDLNLFIDFQMRMILQIDIFLENEINARFFDWMEPGDEEKLWLKFYERLSNPSTQNNPLKFRIELQ